jgi:hypothetical protein
MASSPLPALNGLRFAVGAGAWATPDLAGKLMGLDPDGNPQASFIGRLFGARDVALAVGALSSSGESRRRWIQIGLAVDLADAAAGYLAGRSGVIPKQAAIMATGVALVAAAMGAAALAAEKGEAPAPVAAATDGVPTPIPA